MRHHPHKCLLFVSYSEQALSINGVALPRLLAVHQRLHQQPGQGYDNRVSHPQILPLRRNLEPGQTAAWHPREHDTYHHSLPYVP